MTDLAPNYETSNRIRASDVNDMITSIMNIYGNGFGDYGYGQTDISIPLVKVGDPVKDTEWQNMWKAIYTSMLHQGAAWTDLPPIDYFEKGKRIRAHTLNNNQGDLKGMIESIVNNRLRYKDRSFHDGWINATYTAPWKGILTHQFNIAFDNGDHARHFFNTGGAIIFNTSFSANNKNDDQAMAWEHCINNCSYTFDQTDYYNRATLTPALTVWLNKLVGYKVYEPNSYKDLRKNHFQIEVKRDTHTDNGANGSILTFKLSWVDTYVHPSGDNILGTIISKVDLYIGDKVLKIKLPKYQGRGVSAISIAPARGDEQETPTIINNQCNNKQYLSTHEIVNCP